MPDDNMPSDPPAGGGSGTLAAAVAARAAGRGPVAIADATACVVLFVRLCDDLAAGHRRGVVHGAIAPDTIRFDGDGVATIEELAAQPQGARASLHEDIRGLGACLYLAVASEAPARDRDGSLAEVSFDAAQRIPAGLQQILRQAMGSSAAGGYQTVAELRADLMRFLGGATPQAIRPGWRARTWNWLVLNRRTLALAALVLVLAVGATLAVTWRSVSTFAAWGQPLVVESFAGDGWRERWAARGQWEVKDGRITTRSEYSCALVLKQRLSPPVAIEYRGRIEPGARAGDLSVWWCEGDALEIGSGVRDVVRKPGWFIQAGAYANSWCTIFQAPGGLRSEVNNLVLETGRDYRFRVEIEEDRLRMWIDGKLVLDHHELFPIGSGTIALYSWDPGKTFDDVRVWQREVPELVSPLALGDEAYRAGRFLDADKLYGRVAASHVGKDLGIRALFFQGLAQRRASDPAKAWKTWQRMPDGLLRRRAECLAIDDRVAAGEVASAVERFATMWREHPEVRDELCYRWQFAGQMLNRRQPHPKADVSAWLALRDGLFAEHAASRWLAADMLNNVGRWEEVVSRYADERRAVAPALLSLGRAKKILAASWTVSVERRNARLVLGDLEGLLQSPDIDHLTRLDLLCKLGRAEEAILLDPYPAAFYLGGIEERLAAGAFGEHANKALILLGRLAEAAGDGVPGIPGTGHAAAALTLLGRFDESEKLGPNNSTFRLFAHLAAGRIEEARSLRPDCRGNTDAQYDDLWFAQGPGLALADVALGKPEALRADLERGVTSEVWGKRYALVSRAVLDPAAETALLAMPWRSEAQAWLQVARALRGELAGDRIAALAGWRAFAALPAKDRILANNCLNLEVETCAAWRIADLSR